MIVHIKYKGLRYLVIITILVSIYGCKTIIPTISTIQIPVAASVTKQVDIKNTNSLHTPTVLTTRVNKGRLSKEEVMDFLKKNGSCELPCFMGITVGKTTTEEAQQLLGGFEIQLASTRNPPKKNYITILPNSFPWANEFSINGYFEEENDHISYINFSSTNAYGMSEFSQIWENYSPENILRQKGMPSRILLSTSGNFIGASEKTGYTFWLVYEKYGFFIRYLGTTQKAEQMEFCPQIGQDGQIYDIQLQVLQNNQDILAKDEIITSNLVKIMSLSEATDITEDKYLAGITEGDTNLCFMSKREMWIEK